jgi:hypothetical protein
MEIVDLNNFEIKSLDDIEAIQRKIKKNKKIIIDLSGKYITKGTKYDLIRTVSSNFDWQM